MMIRLVTLVALAVLVVASATLACSRVVDLDRRRDPPSDVFPDVPDRVPDASEEPIDAS
jgi:hypothetical protein